MPSPAPELPRPDSIYSFRVSDSLWLNLPLAENAAAFSKKATVGLRKDAERQWRQALRSYGGNKCMQLQGILGEKAFRMADIAARWNIVQHFYPYHEEDGLQWEAHLPEMIEAVDTLKNGILSREDILTYREAVVRTMGPVRDAHLDISASLHPGFGIVSYYLAEANTTAAPAADTTGTNGDASTFPLPAFPFRMTAVKAVNLDGSRHHGAGVQPDIPAEIGGYEDAVRIIEDFQRQ